MIENRYYAWFTLYKELILKYKSSMENFIEYAI